MPTRAHLSILRSGPSRWNAWREDHPDVRPSLSGTNLDKLGLKGSNLSDADLRSVSLIEADLSGANLSRADLCGSNLRGATMAGTNLYRADLSQTSLGGVDLTKAHLTRAVLARTEVGNACLSGATLAATQFSAVDLSDATGLGSCRHIGPSSLDHSTLLKSRDLPLTFLQGCGLSDAFIDFLPTLLTREVECSCFISHSSDDEVVARQLHADLQKAGVRCWFAPDSLRISDFVYAEILKAIRHSDKLLVVLSESSIESDWVEHEVELALEEESRRNECVLFPIRIDDSVMSASFGWAKRLRETYKPHGRQIGDFRGWKSPQDYEASFRRLLHDLRRKTRQIR